MSGIVGGAIGALLVGWLAHRWATLTAENDTRTIDRLIDQARARDKDRESRP